ncbi:Pantoate-beta-alanine ligase [Maioricimonas rarisocia]|uniref:Pantothenate synthetase n=2 Tax=Maioricimonas rarisocia TaxID=2528026 RepID=A0A517ZAB8_9PLAN|nr:Pantoate-beta-alanine ligase [Maioricimonas rarisocia]
MLMSNPQELVVTTSPRELRTAVRRARSQGQRIGCVPTMGALHEGHVSLIRRAVEKCDFVVVWIFVNPTQFGEGEDLAKYPRPIDDDLKKCSEAGVRLVFMPTSEVIYPDGFSTWVEVSGLSDVLEGSSRPGHFRGVATVVLKLLNLIQPDVAFFGAKDYQQQTLIRRMVADLNLPVEIDVCPTVREEDGLAMSSRNAYLSAEERAAAVRLFEAMQMADARFREGATDVAAVQQEMWDHLNEPDLIEPDYAVIADPDTLELLTSPQSRMVTLIAARVGSTRLIDNQLIQLPPG